jgi:hypothetical protein
MQELQSGVLCYTLLITKQNAYFSPSHLMGKSKDIVFDTFWRWNIEFLVCDVRKESAFVPQKLDWDVVFTVHENHFICIEPEMIRVYSSFHVVRYMMEVG